MTPTLLLEYLALVNVTLALGAEGEIHVTGPRDQIDAWACAIRGQKSVLLALLEADARDSRDERAAIIQYDGGLERAEAERLAKSFTHEISR